MLINPEAIVIITSIASAEEKGWDRAEDRREEKTKRAAWRASPPAGNTAKTADAGPGAIHPSKVCKV